MTSDIDRLFQRTKAQLFTRPGKGFLGPLLCKVQFSWSTEIPTAGINPTRLYWNPDFFLSLSEEARVTVLAHEIWHNGFLHSVRLGTRDHFIWNIAGDHAINLRLKEDGFDFTGLDPVMDQKYKGKSTDEIYDDLIQEMEVNGGRKPDAGDMAGDVMEMEDDSETAKTDAISDVVSATQAARISGNPGDVPGEVALVLDEYLNPKLPWETLLYNFFNALTNKDRSFQRPSRRYTDPIMPGMAPTSGLEHLIYYLDISGSVSDSQIRVFNSEVKFIQEELRPERLTLVTFDTKICDVYKFEIDEPFHAIEVHGRGGTSLNKVYAHMKKHQPTAAVIFTDLWVDIPDNPGIPLVWACTDNPGGAVPYGTLIHINTEEYSR